MMLMRRFAAVSVAVLLLLAMQAGVAGGAPPAARAWQDETIYFLMIDRFANGDPANDADVHPAKARAWHGGDLQGVIDKLDYIKSLGFSAIWITPLVRNTDWDYHGYGAVDFFATDPHFGTVAKARELVEQAHARGMRVIFDMVLNHTGPRSPLVTAKPAWFHPPAPIQDWNDDRQLQEGWLFALPDFDQSNREVREYIRAYSKFWIEQTGVDGFRIDTIRHMPPPFMAWYAAEIEKFRPGFWLIGEAWDARPERLAVYQQAGVPAMLDFPMNEAVRAVIAGGESMERLAAATASVRAGMPDPSQMGGFIDNHDMERFASISFDDSVRRLKLALVFLLTQQDIPIVYYGTEVAMEGGKDPDNRRDFPWGSEQHPDVGALLQRLNATRQAHPALRRGDVTALAVTRWAYAYGRSYGADRVVVVLNNHDREGFDEPVPVGGLGLADGTVLHDAITGREVTVVAGAVRPGLGSRSAAVFVPGPGAGVAPLQPWVSEPVSPWPWITLAAMLAGAGALFGLWLRWRRRESQLTTC